MNTWLQDYEALLARVKGPGVVEPARAAKMSGLELLQGIANGSVPHAPINKTLDFYLLEVEKGRAVFQGRPGMKHYNPNSPCMATFMRRCSTRRWPARSIRRSRRDRRTRRSSSRSIWCVRSPTRADRCVPRERLSRAGAARQPPKDASPMSKDAFIRTGTAACMIFDLDGARA